MEPHMEPQMEPQMEAQPQPPAYRVAAILASAGALENAYLTAVKLAGEKPALCSVGAAFSAINQSVNRWQDTKPTAKRGTGINLLSRAAHAGPWGVRGGSVTGTLNLTQLRTQLRGIKMV